MADKTKTVRYHGTQSRVAAIARNIVCELGREEQPLSGKLYYENCNGDLFTLGGPDHPVDAGQLLALARAIKDNA